MAFSREVTKSRRPYGRTKCDIAGCDRPHYAKNYCRMHWERNHYNGNPIVKKTGHGMSVSERLLRLSEPVGTCREWIGRRSHFGHGQIQVDGKPRVASRVAYETWVGPIPDGLIVRHKCDNPPCIEPSHLEVGTYADNTNDAIVRGRWAFGERNGDARLTNTQALEIYRRVTAGETQRIVAKDFGVGKSTVSRIARGRSWAVVTGAKT